MPRSPLLHGFGLTVRRPRPLIWAYVFNAAIAWLASFAIRTQYGLVMDGSLAAQRMIGGFDLGVLVDAGRRVAEGPRGSLYQSMLAIPVYLLVFFLLVPGTLWTYLADKPVSLGAMLRRGVHSFWSFVRITVLTVLVSGVVLGILFAINGRVDAAIDERMTGRGAFLLEMAGLGVILLVASLLRLYFDLVEVHTVALAEVLLPNGRPDRRVRTVLRPAWRTLTARFGASYEMFVLLALLGAAAVYFCEFGAVKHLAQPRVWPTALLAQLGIFLLMFTRFWQRAAETVLYERVNPVVVRSEVFAAPVVVEAVAVEAAPEAVEIAPVVLEEPVVLEPLVVNDPVPDPEPAAPSLEGPDDGVFGHDVAGRKDLVD